MQQLSNGYVIAVQQLCHDDDDDDKYADGHDDDDDNADDEQSLLVWLFVTDSFGYDTGSVTASPISR